MSTKIIDGARHSSAIVREIASRTESILEKGGRKPGLAVLLLGDNPASRSYVTSKSARARECGFHTILEEWPAQTSEAEALDLVHSWNENPEIDGILVQMPLPSQIREDRIIGAILPEKDVDGFHPLNAGLVCTGLDGFVPCTPMGIRELLVREGITTQGAHVVVIGRSNIVGRPVANLLSQKGIGGDATVTMCHSRSRHLEQHTKSADIIITALGQPEFLKASMVGQGVVVIDVGISRIPDPFKKSGWRLVGDADFPGLQGIASAITPVPGGVGPMTVACLMSNTLKSSLKRQGLS